MGLILGNVFLDGFELNAPIGFGGAQALAIHRLPGGSRIIDAMGPDDHAIRWTGILTGAQASARARALDSMRVAGNQVALAWDVFAATVVIADLRLEFVNSWWIPYQLKCTVLTGTQAPIIAEPTNSILSTITADLGQAGSVSGLSTLLTLISAPDALTIGSQANAAARIAFSQASIGLQVSLQNAEISAESSDLTSVVAAAGSMAALTAAMGYVGRADTNFSGSGI